MNRYDEPFAWEALNAHEEDVWRRRYEEIGGMTKRRPWLAGDSSYVATVEKRIEWIRGYLDGLDYDMAAAFADRTLGHVFDGRTAGDCREPARARGDRLAEARQAHQTGDELESARPIGRGGGRHPRPL